MHACRQGHIESSSVFTPPCFLAHLQVGKAAIESAGERMGRKVHVVLAPLG